MSAVAALAIVFALVRRFSSTTAALLAAVLVATSIPFWAAATTGRFYAPFLLCWYVSALLALGTLGTNPLGTVGTVGTLGTLALLAALCRWTHELAFTLLALPALALLLAPKGEKGVWWRAGAAIGVGLAAAQGLLFVLHYLAPSSGETMIRRFFLWQVVNLFETPPDRQYGLMLAVMVIGWLLAPRQAGLITVIALSGVSLVLAYSIARASNTAPLSRELVAAVMSEGARYPLDMFWHIARANPVTTAVAIGLLIARLARGTWSMAERGMHVLWIGWVLWFGVVESGITINYLLVPMSLMLIAIAVDLAALVHPQAAVVATLVVAGIAADQWRGAGSPAARLAGARPTITAPGIDEIRNGLQPTDRIACTDELGCLMLVGRIDVWLALDDYVRERFLVQSGDEKIVGVYTGVPAVLRPADLFSLTSGGPLPERTLIVDIFKEYPIGNSRTWLPARLKPTGCKSSLCSKPRSSGCCRCRLRRVSPPDALLGR